MTTNTTTYLTRSQGTATSDKIGTFSAWIKSPQEGETNSIFTGYTDNNNKIYSYIGGGGLSIYGATGGSQSLYFVSNRKLRDVNGWYHIVITWDTTQSTQSDRIKIYVNNVQETSFSTASYPSQNADIYWNKGTTSLIGARYVSSIVNFYYGSMSHIHFIDGTAYTPSAFGEYDANGVWTIKTSPSVTYGTNGFFILKDGNSVTDQSGNGNNFTVGGGTLTNTEDCPDNVFATGNALIPSTLTYSNGNLTIQKTTNDWESTGSTIAVTQGKWYAEFKWISGTYTIIGVEDMELVSSWDNEYIGQTANGRGYGWDGNVRNNASTSAFGNSFTTGDIIGVALDMDNKFVYMSKNGVFQNSGVPTSGATGTGGLSLTGTEYIIGWSAYNSVVSANFGNGYFGTTAVASAGTNASGIGIFEYDVPTGYTALSTKGLNL